MRTKHDEINVVYAIEWIRRNGTQGCRWKVKEVFLEKSSAVQAMTQYRVNETRAKQGGWVIEYRLMAYTPANGVVHQRHL